MKLPTIKKALLVRVPAHIFGESVLKSENNWIQSIADSWRRGGCGKSIMCYIRSSPNPMERDDFLVSGNDHSDAEMRQNDEWYLHYKTVELFFPTYAIGKIASSNLQSISE